MIAKSEVSTIVVGFSLPEDLADDHDCDQTRTWARASEILEANLRPDYLNAEISFVHGGTWELELNAAEQCFVRTNASSALLIEQAEADLLAHVDWIEGARKLWNKAYVASGAEPEVGPIGPRRRPSALACRLPAFATGRPTRP